MAWGELWHRVYKSTKNGRNRKAIGHKGNQREKCQSNVLKYPNRGPPQAGRRGKGIANGEGEEGRRGPPQRGDGGAEQGTRALASPPATPDFAELAASRVRLGRPCSAQPRPAFGAGRDCPAGERFRRQTRRNLPAVGVSDSEAGADRRPARQTDNECRAFRCAKGRP